MSSSSSTSLFPVKHSGGGTSYCSFIKQAFVEQLLCIINIPSSIFLPVPAFNDIDRDLYSLACEQLFICCMGVNGSF